MNEHFHSPEPLNSDNTALVLVDHQVGLMTGIRDYSIAELKHNIVGLAKAARVLDLAIVTEEVTPPVELSLACSRSYVDALVHPIRPSAVG
jgi:nicotinamidase-related amidase